MLYSVCAYELGNLEEICIVYRHSKNINEIHFFWIQTVNPWKGNVSLKEPYHHDNSMRSYFRKMQFHTNCQSGNWLP